MPTLCFNSNIDNDGKLHTRSYLHDQYVKCQTVITGDIRCFL